MSQKRSAGRPKIASDQDQREHILAVAGDLMRGQGYARTTMDEVAAHAQISKRTLYRLFASKIALFAALIESHRQSVLALPGAYDHLPLTEALARIFMIDVLPERDRERVGLLRLIVVEARQHPELRELAHELGRNRVRELLSAWLSEQVANSRLQIADVSSATQILLDMIFGAILRTVIDDAEAEDGAARTEYLRRCIEIFVHGTATANHRAK